MPLHGRVSLWERDVARTAGHFASRTENSRRSTPWKKRVHAADLNALPGFLRSGLRTWYRTLCESMGWNGGGGVTMHLSGHSQAALTARPDPQSLALIRAGEESGLSSLERRQLKAEGLAYLLPPHVW